MSVKLNSDECMVKSTVSPAFVRADTNACFIGQLKDGINVKCSEQLPNGVTVDWFVTV